MVRRKGEKKGGSRIGKMMERWWAGCEGERGGKGDGRG